MTNPIEGAAGLSCWGGGGKVDPKPVGSGITNQNFVVKDGSQRFFVRIGDDIPERGIMGGCFRS